MNQYSGLREVLQNVIHQLVGGLFLTEVDQNATIAETIGIMLMAMEAAVGTKTCTGKFRNSVNPKNHSQVSRKAQLTLVHREDYFITKSFRLVAKKIDQ